MFHVYRYAMAQVKDTPPPPPGAKIRATKSMIGTKKELPSDDSATSSGTTGNVEAKEELAGQIEEKIQTIPNPSEPKEDTPEIKANSADLNTPKDTSIGASDLKKP